MASFFFMAWGIFRINLNVMKKSLFFFLFLLAAAGCRKDFKNAGNAGGSSFSLVLAQLRDSLSSAGYEALDTGRMLRTVLSGDRGSLVRVAYKGVSARDSFLLVLLDRSDRMTGGRIVRLTGTGRGIDFFSSGSITVRDLRGGVLVQSAIVRGYVVTNHPKLLAHIRTLSVGGKSVSDWDDEDELDDVDWDELPECVVVADTWDASDYEPYVGASAVDYPTASGDYIPVDAPAPGGGGASGDSTVALAIQPEVEYTNSLKVVNIKNVFNCFTLVPNAGATYTIQLCADVPVNSNPGASMDYLGGVSAGHSFLVVTKTNGSSSVTQSFGFYPAQSPSAWSAFDPMPSAVKDNGAHEINASITMNISEYQFATVQAGAIAYATNSYVLDSYNCTDYALGVFNSVRSTPLTLEPYTATIPGTSVNGVPLTPDTHFTINNSPQGLYNALTGMKSSGSAEAGNIQTDLSGKTLAPVSHGECP
jgi:hypothetical protein